MKNELNNTHLLKFKWPLTGPKMSSASTKLHSPSALLDRTAPHFYTNLTNYTHGTPQPLVTSDTQRKFQIEISIFIQIGLPTH
jgi:hypothetical protein